MLHNILLIDDDEAILDAFRSLLTSRSYAVDCARDIEEAKAHLDQSAYSVVISDLSFGNGEMDGLQVLQYLAELPRKPLIVVCSGSTANEVKEMAIGRGANMFLGKPFSFKAFLNKLDDLLSNSSADSWPLGSVEASRGENGVQHFDCR